MSKGVPLPFVTVMLFGSCVVAGTAGYFLGREQKSPAVTVAAERATAPPPSSSTPFTAKTGPLPTPNAKERVPDNDGSHAADARTTAKQKAKPEPVISRPPTLEEVIVEAERIVEQINKDEPAATEARISSEVDGELKSRMIYTADTFRKYHRIGMNGNDALKLGLVEMHERYQVSNSSARDNVGLKAAIGAHYDASLKNGKLELKSEAVWVVSAWKAIGSAIFITDVTEGCYRAAAYFKGEKVVGSNSPTVIAIYNSLTKRN